MAATKRKYVVRVGWFEPTFGDHVTNDNINDLAPRLEAEVLETRLLLGHLAIVQDAEDPAPAVLPGTPIPGAAMIDGIPVTTVDPEVAEELAQGDAALMEQDTEPEPVRKRARAHRQ